jgi:ABC-type branched-subunit amino acid transport system ATPase component
MKFQFEKLGALDKQTQIELGDLTILCGANNTGKTYTTRAIYGFLKRWESQIDFKITDAQIQSLFQNGVLKIDLTSLSKKIPQVLDALSKEYTVFLPKLFNANEDLFFQTAFQALLNGYQPNYQKELHLSAKSATKDVLNLVKDKDSTILDVSLLVEDKNLLPHAKVVKKFLNKGLGQALLGEYFAKPFLITSERIGITLFHNALNTGHSFSHYAHPVADDIDFVRDIVNVHSKQKSPLIKEHPEIASLLKAIVGGEYTVANNQIFFSFLSGSQPVQIPLNNGSATVASQVEINFYLKCLAQQGDILLIDEPEQYLHPANQRKMARLFVHLIKAGIKVFITTQSDYLIKELNHLIILSHQFDDREEIMKKYQYTEEEVLDRFKVKAYSADKRTLVRADIDEMGIEVAHFDKEIDEMNHLYNEMTVTLPFAYVD